MAPHRGKLGTLALLAAVALATPSHAADKLRVGTPEATAFAFAILDVGIGAGMFAKHDLDVEKINFAGGSKMEQGMSSGAIDLSIAGNAELAFVAKGVPQIGVAVTAGAPVDMAVIVRNDKDIATVADLKGKTIGVTSETSLTSYLALALSERQGWGKDGMKRAYIGGMSSSVPALLVKNVDAIVGPVEGGLILEISREGEDARRFRRDRRLHHACHVGKRRPRAGPPRPGEALRRGVVRDGRLDGGPQGRDAAPRLARNQPPARSGRQGL